MSIIRLAENTIEQNELNNLCDWIKEGNQLTKGKLTVEFEKQFSEYIGTKYSVFVNSGSSANLVMFYALEITQRLKNKVAIIPAISWITTLSPALQLGFDVHLCDADKNNLGLDVNHFEELCKTHQPSVAILVHVLAHPNDMEAIYAICEKYGVILLEDSCEALGTKYNQKMIGNLALAGSFSFYYGHHISTIEGGIVTTNDRELYNLILSIRSHGWARDIETDFHNEWKQSYNIDEFRDYYTFYHPGYNLRSTDLNAFLGLSQIKKMDGIVEKRQENFNIYKSKLGEKYWCQNSNYDTLSSFAYGTIVENRLEVFHHLKKNGIETRPLICGSMGKQPFWIKRFGETKLAVADIVHDYGLYLPNHYNLSNKDVEFVCEKFSEVAIPKFFN